jgi:hypothetical protein
MELRPYTSFLIRLWRLGQSQTRVKIEHIQTGEVTQVGSLADALLWLEGQADEPRNEQEGGENWECRKR